MKRIISGVLSSVPVTALCTSFVWFVTGRVEGLF